MDDARLEDSIALGQVYPLHLRIDGGNVILSPAGENGEKTMSHDFGRPLNGGALGLAVDGARMRFDDLRVSAGDDIHVERFADGRADGFETLGGTWRVVDWAFEDVSARARVNEPQLGRKAIFVDYDHDNDLDLFVVNGAELSEPPSRDEFVVPDDFPGQADTLLRNDGSGTFGDLTDEAGLLVGMFQTSDVVFGDWDGDYDTDLFVANADADSLLLTNQRSGRFAVAAGLAPPIDGGARAVASGDFNRDVANGRGPDRGL
jgi:hypothetical protein